jgi:siroheme synthase
VFEVVAGVAVAVTFGAMLGLLLTHQSSRRVVSIRLRQQRQRSSWIGLRRPSPW